MGLMFAWLVLHLHFIAFWEQIRDLKPLRYVPPRPMGKQVANITGTSKDNSLTTVQWSTLQWMAWRESGEAGGSEREEGSPEVSRLANVVRGGMLGHLSSPDASTCVLALIQKETANAAEGRVERWVVRPLARGQACSARIRHISGAMSSRLPSSITV